MTLETLKPLLEQVSQITGWEVEELSNGCLKFEAEGLYTELEEPLEWFDEWSIIGALDTFLRRNYPKHPTHFIQMDWLSEGPFAYVREITSYGGSRSVGQPGYAPTRLEACLLGFLNAYKQPVVK
jgi:hypothetical protein